MTLCIGSSYDSFVFHCFLQERHEIQMGPNSNGALNIQYHLLQIGISWYLRCFWFSNETAVLWSHNNIWHLDISCPISHYCIFYYLTSSTPQCYATKLYEMKILTLDHDIKKLFWREKKLHLTNRFIKKNYNKK